jgi:hypothetical protein
MATYYHDFGSFLQDYINQIQRFIPQLKPPTQLDPSNLIKGVQPVLQQEERRAQQAAAAQFAKLGIPVSSAYQERLGRIGGETAAKLADITNRYMFEAAKENAQMQWQAQLEQYRQMMDLLKGLLPSGLAQLESQSKSYGTGAYYAGAGATDPVSACMRNARTIEEYAKCQADYQAALSRWTQQPATNALEQCQRDATSPEQMAACVARYQNALAKWTSPPPPVGAGPFQPPPPQVWQRPGPAWPMR